MSPQATVLLVDDEIRSLEALQRTLEDDFTLFTASSADEALAILESEFIQVIVTDQRMPDMTGVALLRRVRERHPQVVRIILSGYTDNADIIAAVNEAPPSTKPASTSTCSSPGTRKACCSPYRARPSCSACSRTTNC